MREIVIAWPDGLRQTFHDTPHNQSLEIHYP